MEAVMPGDCRLPLAYAMVGPVCASAAALMQPFASAAVK
ncbi:hypothetical protein AmDm5_0465 [Acetobacter malorum]|nr:hypothetical protein AmDm5_0465 [Acetobacter malorum]